MVKKYIRIYNKRNFMLSLLCASIAFLPLFIVSLVYDVIAGDTLIAFIPFAIGAIYVAVASLFTLRFQKMIRQQEQRYNIHFNDKDVVHLETNLYLSRDWLIWAGSSAIYKKHIKSISSQLITGKGGSSNEVIIKTVDNKRYRIWCLDSSNIVTIRKWKKQ